MKFSENWLREWVDPPVDTDELCRQLTMAGLEVDEVAPAAPVLDRVVVGVIRSLAVHPRADNLSVCQVDCGEPDLRTIICGAPNTREGLNAPVALPGAALPNGVTVEIADLRGLRSEGMLCAAAELGLSEDDAGLMTLDRTATPGAPLYEHLALADHVIEIDLTPNRGDCLSLRGVAREVGVWNRLSVAAPEYPLVPAAHRCELTARIADPAACSAYAGRVITGVDPSARTPDWMRERLRRSGLRPILPAVDITNYVMLECGQPMHGFDLDRLNGAIQVRNARGAERLALLDGGDIALRTDTLVIADDDGPVALAGIMGGLHSAMADATRNIFLESACFAPTAVAGQGRHYKRHTDALHRFERGVDDSLQVPALERATALILTIMGGSPGPVMLAGGQATGAAKPIGLRRARLARLLGTQVADAEVADTLERLEMQVTPTPDGWSACAPSHRYDLVQEADLIEEVARIHGYDRLPARRQPVFTAGTMATEEQRALATIREVLRQRGYDEAISYSFVDKRLQEILDPDSKKLDLDNPIAENYAQMRSTLWASLIPCWLHNLRRRRQRIRLFESGLRFVRDEAALFGIDQRPSLAGVASGAAMPSHWDSNDRALDFFDLKGDVQALLSTRKNMVLQPDSHPGLHPGRCARITVGGELIGWLGQLHPALRSALDVKTLPYVFDLDMAAVAAATVPRFQPISEFPEVRRDLAVIVPEAVAVGDLLKVLEAAGESWLQRTAIFDVFRGGDLETGCKSVALSLIFQDKQRTLTAEGVEEAVARLIASLQRNCGASLRGQ